MENVCVFSYCVPLISHYTVAFVMASLVFDVSLTHFFAANFQLHFNVYFSGFIKNNFGGFVFLNFRLFCSCLKIFTPITRILQFSNKTPKKKMSFGETNFSHSMTTVLR